MMTKTAAGIIFTILTTRLLNALDNGLALTPPMGWLSWERFGCNIDCETNPDTCISESLYLTQAQLMVDKGYRDAGYRYVNIDDCWSEKERDENGDIVADLFRFPNGIRSLARNIHSMNLLLGLYGDIGSKTCAGYPGFEGNYVRDAKMLAQLEIDFIKVDGCNADPSHFNHTYPEFGRALNQTGRQILYNCQWPLYDDASHHGEDPDILNNQVGATCNQWRNYYDIFDDWTSVRATIDYWSRSSHNDIMVRAGGPGHWNDPDMLVVGNPGLSLSEQQAQFALWAIFAAPLLISVDLRHISNESAAILRNREVIAINQDPLGHQGYCAHGASTNIRVYIRELLPSNGVPCARGASDSWAVVMANFGSIFHEREIVFDPKLHLPSGNSCMLFQARDVILHKDIGGPLENLAIQVDESSISMYKVVCSSLTSLNELNMTLA
ncbi:hypothetical protein MPSEU_000629400 [Mayamaea pseudoterrestris]|nr:hypothetical protein MPSEU_000629400 [Mayamaea pseudoterrestris]